MLTLLVCVWLCPEKRRNRQDNGCWSQREQSFWDLPICCPASYIFNSRISLTKKILKDSEKTIQREQGSGAGNGAKVKRGRAEKGRDSLPVLHKACLSNSGHCLFGDSAAARPWPQAPMARLNILSQGQQHSYPSRMTAFCFS